MLEAAIHKEAEATLNRLFVKHSDLKNKIGKAYGYAVFPSIGRAGVVIGGAYGEGEVYEQGQPVGFATMSQITVGVQVGGQTFSEILFFNDQKTLDEFKHRGRLGFSANASAVLVKAAATATSSPKGMQAKAYSQGGMLLELSLGGSNFLFVPPLSNSDQQKERLQSQVQAKKPDEQNEDTTKQEQEKQELEQYQRQHPEQNKEFGNANKGPEENKNSNEFAHSGAFEQFKQIPVVGQFLSSSAQKLASQIPKNGKGSPFQKIGKLFSSLQQEQSLNKVLHKEVQGSLKIIADNHPDFKKALEKAYGYAVFPAAGRASAVISVTYGKGQVFEQGHLVGYAGIVQVTLGVQLGGETVTQVVLFTDKAGLDRFKQNKFGFAANASAVIVKAGAAATNSYQSDRVYTFSEGGLLIEAAIGIQKFIFKPAALTRGTSIEDKKEKEAKAA